MTDRSPRLARIPLTATLGLAAVLAFLSAVPVTAVEPAAEPLSGTITLYTSVTQDTVDAVLAELAVVYPALDVEVLRAPTGELDARIAAERRSGGLRADVLWMTDPLSMQRYEADGLLRPFAAGSFPDVPDAYQGESFVGTRLLNLVIVAGRDEARKPDSWDALADASLLDGVVMPDPGFAGSAFAALGYFATSAEYGIDFYAALKDNGAVQLASPGEVVSAVAEGRARAGIALDKSVRSAMAKGSPIELIWPEGGAIALYSPAAVVDSSDDAAAAIAFVDFLVSPQAQSAIASTGWQPVHPGVEWEHAGEVVTPDWDELFGRQVELLEAYRAIYGD